MSVPTFVVGTGRCGSTMLSNMLREHPKVLSLSEFFSMISDGDFSDAPFSPDPLDGKRFWSIVGGVAPFYAFFLRQGLDFPELLYPYNDPSSRFSTQTGVPAILLTTLPHLTNEHDAVFAILSEEVSTWQRRMIAEHYRHLFTWLMEYFGKQLWVERSGALRYAGQYLALFPDARFVHIVRDGRDAALSMRKHNAWRLGLAWYEVAETLGVNPYESPDRTYLDRVPAHLTAFLPEHFDAAAFRDFEIPLAPCAGYWVQNLIEGMKVLSALSEDRLLTLRYEDFFVSPQKQLYALAAFLGDEFIDEDWSARCAATVRLPRSTWRDLPEEEARALTEACRPGFELLRDVGVDYAA